MRNLPQPTIWQSVWQVLEHALKPGDQSAANGPEYEHKEPNIALQKSIKIFYLVTGEILPKRLT